MSDKTKIEWSNATWNFITGCDEISAGCDLCYAKTFAERWRGTPGHYFEFGFDLQIRADKLDLPLLWKRARKIFVNSMSDLFHKDVPAWVIIHAFAVMALTPHHIYQILTKRHGRMRSLLSDPEFWVEVGRKARELRPSYANAAAQLADGRSIDDPATWETIRSLPNVWLGVSVENQQWADIRIPALLETPAAVRFLSCEPLLGPLDLTPWMSKETTCGCDTKSRGRRLQGGRSGRVDDRRRGASLEGGRPAWEQVVRGNQTDPLQSATGRASVWEVPAGAGDVRLGSVSRSGASTGLETLVRLDSGRSYGEPQERQAHGQPSEQPGAGNPCGATGSRAEGSPERAARSVRRAESDGEAVVRPGAGDLFQAGGRGTSTCPRCGLRCLGTDDLEDRARRPSITWVIAGGESGRGARPAELGWFTDLAAQCKEAGTAFFMKQLGVVLAKQVGATGKGGDPDEWPLSLPREFPEYV